MKYIYLRLRNQDQHLSTSEHVRNVKKRKKEIKNNICPICKKPLVLREGKTGKFYGCSGYPRCKFTKKI